VVVRVDGDLGGQDLATSLKMLAQVLVGPSLRQSFNEQLISPRLLLIRKGILSASRLGHVEGQDSALDTAEQWVLEVIAGSSSIVNLLELHECVVEVLEHRSLDSDHTTTDVLFEEL